MDMTMDITHLTLMEIQLYLKEILELTNFRENNIDISRIEENLHYTPGDSIRKYFFNLDGNLEHLKKNNVELFYKIISEKIINKFKNEHLEILRKTKVNLIFKNDISRIIEKLS